MTAPIRIGIYVRVSTKNQSTDTQLREILDHFKRKEGLQQHIVYDDSGYTGTNGNRPALKQLFNDVENGKLDAVAIYKYDRLFRSLEHLMSSVKLFKTLGINFISIKDDFDLETPVGELMMQILGSFAQFEAKLISSRVKDGIHNYKEVNGRWGKRRTVNYEAIVESVNSGRTYEYVAQTFSTTKSAVQRAMKAYNKSLHYK